MHRQETPLRKPDRVNIPNIITLGRILLVPVVFWLVLSGRSQLAFVLFAVAGISDAIDGWLAKGSGWQTELGAYLDPLADKLLVVSIFIAMGWLGELPSMQGTNAAFTASCSSGTARKLTRRSSTSAPAATSWRLTPS